MPSPRMERARDLAQERRLRTALQQQLSSNQTDIYVLNARELTGIWVNLQKGRNLWENETASLFEEVTGFALSMVLDHTGTASSAIVLAKLGADMHRSGSIFGTYRIIQREGKQLIVLSGYGSSLIRVGWVP